MPGEFNRMIAENRTLIAAHAAPDSLARALFMLDEAGILTEASFPEKIVARSA